MQTVSVDWIVIFSHNSYMSLYHPVASLHNFPTSYGTTLQTKSFRIDIHGRTRQKENIEQ